MPKVTEITRQEKDKFRCSIFFDGKFGFGCSEEMLLSLGLREGDELTDERILQIKDLLRGDVIRQKALWFLSQRNHSKLEMKRFLQKKRFDADQIEATLSWLALRGYLDEEKFANEWVRMRESKSSRGRRGLLNELQSRGIDRETAVAVVDENLPESREADVAFQLLIYKKKRFQVSRQPNLKAKIYNFLSYRGFSLEATAEAYRRYVAGQPGTEDAEQ